MSRVWQFPCSSNPDSLVGLCGVVPHTMFANQEAQREHSPMQRVRGNSPKGCGAAPKSTQLRHSPSTDKNMARREGKQPSLHKTSGTMMQSARRPILEPMHKSSALATSGAARELSRDTTRAQERRTVPIRVPTLRAQAKARDDRTIATMQVGAIAQTIMRQKTTRAKQSATNCPKG